MALGKKTGGRKPGSKNKRTREREARIAAAIEQAKAEGREMYSGDPVDFLETVWRDPTTPQDLRVQITMQMAKYYRPTKTENTNLGDNTRYLVALPNGETSMDEWKAKYAPKPVDDKKTEH